MNPQCSQSILPRHVVQKEILLDLKQKEISSIFREKNISLMSVHLILETKCYSITIIKFKPMSSVSNHM